MQLNIEQTISEKLKSSMYKDSYLVGNYTHKHSEGVEILSFNSSCPELDANGGAYIRHHVLVAYFGTIVYYDSNVIDRSKKDKYPPRDIAQRAINYLRHRASQIESQINIF